MIDTAVYNEKYPSSCALFSYYKCTMNRKEKKKNRSAPRDEKDADSIKSDVGVHCVYIYMIFNFKNHCNSW